MKTKRTLSNRRSTPARPSAGDAWARAAIERWGLGDPPIGSPLALAAKRAFDVAASGALMAALSPLFLFLMALIALDSPGNPFFAQPRVGRHGDVFMIFKFRTMSKEAPKLRAHVAGHNGADRLLFKMKGDPRVTRLGRFLRKYSLDELPQLMNVWLGEMSLVGPRPLLLEDFERTDPDIPGYREWYHQRHRMRPGLSGLWQVSGRHALPFDRAMAVDVAYVQGWSLRRDLAILARTPAAVLRGAY